MLSRGSRISHTKFWVYLGASGCGYTIESEHGHHQIHKLLESDADVRDEPVSMLLHERVELLLWCVR